MDSIKKRALIGTAIIFLILGIYYTIRYYIIKSYENVRQKVYKKSYDLCRVLSTCDNHSYTGTDTSLPTYVESQKTSEKQCALTETSLDYRKKFKCQYDNINSISRCHDCLDYDFEENVCGDRTHDLDTYGIRLPTYNKCINGMGTNEKLDLEFLKNSYGLEITDKDPDDYYRGLDNDWWNNHDHLYKCLTAHPNYYFNGDSSSKLLGFDADEFKGYASSNFFRTLSCSVCFKLHGDNVENYNSCMQSASECYQNPDLTNSDCDEMNNAFNSMK
jgi:hypothetical protein